MAALGAMLATDCESTSTILSEPRLRPCAGAAGSSTAAGAVPSIAPTLQPDRCAPDGAPRWTLSNATCPLPAYPCLLSVIPLTRERSTPTVGGRKGSVIGA